ncbi:hypothetical protein DNU06_05835 [Putridiphycobacter roseus]|uniref:Uncharacterized protein n=1 Tax=Putridiphycobacter roseus TaxID=2219161 RepID=A0A2W1NJK1_9FLAO|nr:hypothetical protein DNU06_05835 [Putridiphycobacter roseus]
MFVYFNTKVTTFPALYRNIGYLRMSLKIAGEKHKILCNVFEEINLFSKKTTGAAKILIGKKNFSGLTLITKKKRNYLLQLFTLTTNRLNHSCFFSVGMIRPLSKIGLIIVSCAKYSIETTNYLLRFFTKTQPITSRCLFSI